MVRVKICGITDVSDARMAAERGADALGFIFYPKSQRYLGRRRRKKLFRSFPVRLLK